MHTSLTHAAQQSHARATWPHQGVTNHLSERRVPPMQSLVQRGAPLDVHKCERGAGVEQEARAGRVARGGGDVQGCIVLKVLYVWGQA